VPRVKPVVGVTGPDRGNSFARAFTAWMLGAAGARVRAFRPARREGLEAVDALVLTGGRDIEPVRYGAPERGARNWDRVLDEFEFEAVDRAAARGIPVLGICRGAQLLNVRNGGTLYQDLGDEIPGVRASRTILPRMRVDVVPGTHLAGLLGVQRARVNSLHHQAVRDPAPGWRVAARDRAGIVEAIEAEEAPLRVGVQWHPEYMPCSRVQRRLFRRFVDRIGSRDKTGRPATG